MLRLHHHEIEILIENVPHYGIGESDSSRRYDREIHYYSTTEFRTTSKHSVTTLRSGHGLASVILLAGGGVQLRS